MKARHTRRGVRALGPALALAAALGTLPGHDAAAATPPAPAASNPGPRLGTLFYSPQQRLAIDRARAGTAIERTEVERLRLDGTVGVSGATTRHFVNGREWVDAPSAFRAASLRPGQSKAADGTGDVQDLLPDGSVAADGRRAAGPTALATAPSAPRKPLGAASLAASAPPGLQLRPSAGNPKAAAAAAARAAEPGAKP
jgi:hypothetical protein